MLNCIPNQITDEMNQNLTRMVIDEEVKQVAFQMGGSWAPGLDEFLGLFYHRLWEELIIESTNWILYSICEEKELEDGHEEHEENMENDKIVILVNI